MNKRPLIPQSAGEATEVSVRFHRKWAERFRRAKWLVLLFLFLFALLMLLFFKSSINYENFLFLLRDLDAEYHADADVGGIGVYYDADTEMTCHVFKNHLVVIDTGHVSLYGLSGYRVFTYPHKYRNPVVVVSDNYFIVYDLGGYRYSFYNAIGLLKESKTYDYPIIGAVVADNGTHAILTKNQTYRSTVQVFDNECDLLASYHTMRYVTSIALNDSATRIQTASLYIDADNNDRVNGENGVPRMVLQTYVVGTKEEKIYFEYPTGNITDVALKGSSVIPLDIGNVDDSIAVLCNNGVLLYESGTFRDEKRFFSFLNDLPSGIGKLSTAAYGEDYLALLFLDAVNESTKHLCILGENGTLAYGGAISVDGQITALSYHGNNLFLLSPTHVYKMEKNGKLTSETLNEHSEIVGFSAYSDTTAIVSYTDKTVAVTFD